MLATENSEKNLHRRGGTSRAFEELLSTWDKQKAGGIPTGRRKTGKGMDDMTADAFILFSSCLKGE